MSPFLFALSLEPLAQKVREHCLISPITFCNTSHSISLYADDILLYLDKVPLSLPNVLDTFDAFSSLSGYRINWNKSVLFPLNGKIDMSDLTQNIPVVNQFRYLGVNIHPNLGTITNKNFQGLHDKIEADLNRWSFLPNSLQSRISVIKMDILPRLNFLSSMLPLAPPKDFWKKMHSLVSSFIWGGKRPRVKITTLQRNRLKGGLSVPNFELYSWAFTLRPVSVWLDGNADVSWREIEKDLALPYRLEDLVYSSISLKLNLGPIVSHTLYIWHQVEGRAKSQCKWHLNTPIFNNHPLLLGGASFKNAVWSGKGINKLSDLYSTDGLCSFSELSQKHNLPSSSFFLYLQLRASMKAYGVPWNSKLPIHPIHAILTNKEKKGKMVTRIYNLMCSSNN